MGTAMYVVLDNPNPGFETFVNGKAVARSLEELQALCGALRLPILEEFVSVTADDMADLLGDFGDIDLGPLEEQWFAPEDGLSVLEPLRNYLQGHPDALANSAAVLADLSAYISVLDQAKAIGAQWRFAVDI